MELDRRRSPTRALSRNEVLFMRTTGLSKEEWIEQEIREHRLMPAEALRQYRHLVQEIVDQHLKAKQDDETSFRSAVEAMRGTDLEVEPGQP